MSDQIPKMPEPVEVWLSDTDAGYFVEEVPDGYKGEWGDSPEGPFKLYHSMMSLDELAGHGLFVQRRYVGRVHGVIGLCWDVVDTITKRFATVVSEKYDTALEAQWAATCIARTKQEK